MYGSIRNKIIFPHMSLTLVARGENYNIVYENKGDSSSLNCIKNNHHLKYSVYSDHEYYLRLYTADIYVVSMSIWSTICFPDSTRTAVSDVLRTTTQCAVGREDVTH